MTDDAFAVRIQAHRPYLLRVAVLQLRDNHLAEDVVEETIVAALEGQSRFSGRSSVKTWLTGILKHKIVDAIRRKSREPARPALEEEPRIDEFDALFDRSGHWETAPADWGDPEAQMSQRQFFDVRRVLSRQAAAQHGAGLHLHDARSHGTRKRRDL